MTTAIRQHAYTYKGIPKGRKLKIFSRLRKKTRPTNKNNARIFLRYFMETKSKSNPRIFGASLRIFSLSSHLFMSMTHLRRICGASYTERIFYASFYTLYLQNTV